jgi:hypothetical protein
MRSKVLKTIVCLVVILLTDGCGSNRPAKELRNVNEAVQLLQQNGYQLVEEQNSAHFQERIGFPILPQYGEIKAAYIKGSLTVLVLRANQHTQRAQNPAIYWFRSDDVVLIGIPPPPFTTDAAQFRTLTDEL